MAKRIPIMAAKQVADVESFTFGDVELNFKKYAARKGGRALELSAREFEILRYLIRHRGEIVTRDQLLDEVWGYAANPITRTVDNHIARLRQKIETDLWRDWIIWCRSGARQSPGGIMISIRIMCRRVYIGHFGTFSP